MMQVSWHKKDHLFVFVQRSLTRRLFSEFYFYSTHYPIFICRLINTLFKKCKAVRRLLCWNRCIRFSKKAKAPTLAQKSNHKLNSPRFRAYFSGIPWIMNRSRTRQSWPFKTKNKYHCLQKVLMTWWSFCHKI